MVDAVVVVSYLAAQLMRGSRRFVDRRFDEAFEGVWRRAQYELSRRGDSGELRALKKKPLDDYIRSSVARSLQEAMKDDPAFAAALEQDVRYLDSRGGRDVIRAIETDPFYSKVWWVVALAVTGAVLCFLGLGLFFFTLFTEMNETQFGPQSHTPPGYARGFAIFFAGLGVLALAGIANAIKRR